MCLPWSISIVMTHNLAQNSFLIYTGFSASNGGHFSVYSTTFLPFFERKLDAYLRRSGGFMCQMTAILRINDVIIVACQLVAHFTLRANTTPAMQGRAFDRENSAEGLRC